MRRILSIVLLGLFCGSANAQAVYPGMVEGCFAAAGPGEVAPVCLGNAAGACQSQGFDTTIGISQCIQAETAVWDQILNREYKAVRGAFQGRFAGQTPLNDMLLGAQRAWIAYRDAECALAYGRYADGTLRSIVAANCMMVMTAQRAIELRDMKEF